MLAILLATFSVPAGALFWYKILLPIDRMLQHSAEEQHPDWATNPNRSILIPESHTADGMSGSLVKLSNVLESSSPVQPAEARPQRDHEVANAA